MEPPAADLQSCAAADLVLRRAEPVPHSQPESMPQRTCARTATPAEQGESRDRAREKQKGEAADSKRTMQFDRAAENDTSQAAGGARNPSDASCC